MGNHSLNSNAKPSAGNASLALLQEYQQNGVIKTAFPWDYSRSLLILHSETGNEKEGDVFFSHANPESSTSAADSAEQSESVCLSAGPCSCSPEDESS